MTRPPGKKIDTWTFTIDGQRVKVDVRMDPGARTDFLVRHDLATGERISLRNPDINALRKEVEDALRAKIRVHWERFLYIETCGGLEPSLEGAAQKARLTEESQAGETWARHDWLADAQLHALLRLDYRTIEIGTRADGSQCYRELASSHGHNVHEGLPHLETPDSEERGFRSDDYPTQSAYLPDTPANRAALELIRAGLDLVRQRLQELLSHETIAATLQQVLTSPAVVGLPAPPPPPPAPPQAKKKKRKP